MRADAVANRDRLVASAKDLVLKRGADVALQEVADAAGVGIGTLYRHFPDRPALLRAVAIHSLDALSDAAQSAGAEGDALVNLNRYLHDAIDLRVSALIPMLLDSIEMHDADVRVARDRSAAALNRLVDDAHSAGQLSAQVSAGDLGILLVRLSRPLPGKWDPAAEDQLAHRHLDLLVSGATRDYSSLPGNAFELNQLYREN